MFQQTVLCILLLLGIAPALNAADQVPLSRIAFGSCARQDQPQPIWDAVIETRPQLFVFLGDNIDGDTTDMDVLRARYALLANQPGLRRLKEICPVIGTWDDHDYAANDAGADYSNSRIAWPR